MKSENKTVLSIALIAHKSNQFVYKFPSNKYIHYEFTFNLNRKYSTLTVLCTPSNGTSYQFLTCVMLTSLEKPSSLLCCMTEQEDCSWPHSAEIPCTFSSNTRSRSPLDICFQPICFRFYSIIRAITFSSRTSRTPCPRLAAAASAGVTSGGCPA